MNLQHLKYMVEVERVGSITKAASNLFMGQPNLSKAIKEVENEVGIPIFKRSAKGVFPTEKGAEFFEYAHAILAQMDKIEALYKPEISDRITFSISVPRASYVTHAFASFVNKIDKSKKLSIDFKETNSVDAISNVAEGNHNMAIIRYENAYEEYFLSMLAEKALKYETVLKFEYMILTSAKSSLAGKKQVCAEDLEPLTEIVHGDNSVPYLSSAYTKKNNNDHGRRIYVYERGSQFDILQKMPESYMWVSPVPSEVLDRAGLVQLKCFGDSKHYKDLLIYSSAYRFNEIDNAFFDELYAVRDEIAIV